MRRIGAKTATLLAACCDIGALLGGIDQSGRSALRKYGRLLGLAFQIADDVLDYEGSEDEIGKPIGHDVAEGFATLPLMLSMDEVQTAVKLKKLLTPGRELSASEALEVVDLVRASRGPQRALERARELSSEARQQLEALGSGDALDALEALTTYVVSRKL
jgi:geranylgeranyl pyrophosphate synthase